MVEEESYQAGSKMGFYTLFVVIILITLLAMMFFFSSYTTQSLYTSNAVEGKLYSTIYTERFLNSPDCFAYQDTETGNVYSDIIDKSKFTEERLNNCYKPKDTSPYEFLLTLVDKGVETTIQTKEFGALKTKTPRFVMIYDNGQIRTGTLFVGIQGVQ